ncbi:MAG: hypothetical protein WCF30_10795 [Terracidiphilus sp.]
MGTATFEPIFDYSFDFSPETGYGSLNSIDENTPLGLTDSYAGGFLATGGTLTIPNTSSYDVGTYQLIPGGPSAATYETGGPSYDNLLYPAANPQIDSDGLLFGSSSFQISLLGTGTSSYSFSDYTYSSGTDTKGHSLTSGTLKVNTDPGGGQTYPAKYTWDVTATPSCTSDYVVIGIPANPASGGQANIVGYNNLYSSSAGGDCTGTGPDVMFAYASGSGEVPASVVPSLNGEQIAYVEDLLTGSSYFHVLTIGTTGTNGASATAAVVPGTGNNAVDNKVSLSQSSTTSPFVNYATNVAYVTTYSWVTGTGYLYKISPVFSSSAPAIVWSVSIDAVPSGPVYDSTSSKAFFTDSEGRIDYVTDGGSSGTLTIGPVVASGTTSLNPVTVDSVNEMVYATFNNNTNGDEIVVQSAISTLATLADYAVVPVGISNLVYTAPYGVEFNNYWYTGTTAGSESSPLLYVVGTDTTTGITPTLYDIGFTSGALDSTATSITALTGGQHVTDTTAPTEFYNPNVSGGVDFLFFTLSDLCGVSGSVGCVLEYDVNSNGLITSNYLAVTGGSTGIVVDNDGTGSQESNIYYATKLGQSGVLTQPSLVKLTQNGLD